MDTRLDLRRVLIFIAFAFGIAWATALVIYLTGGLVNSPQIVPGIYLALILLAGPYMFAPSLANILTRVVTREGWGDLFIRPIFKKTWPFWLGGWFLPGLLTLLGGAIFYLLFPQNLDLSFPLLAKQIELAGVAVPFDVKTLALIQLVQGFLLAPVNLIATFGEEFGWRAYLLQKFMALGRRKALLWMGLIWGVWHWPVIFMGYEYGFEYPGAPWLGPLVFIWITFSFGTLLSWLALRGKSVWPAALGHAAINAIAGISVVAMSLANQPNPLLGPTSVGVLGSAGFGIAAVVLFLWERPWGKKTEPQIPQIVADEK